jgi:hypothetical protein
LAPASTAEPPELPAERDWHTLTARWWADVWASPMAGEYLDADVHGLFRLALLVDDYWLASSPTGRRDLAGEIRLQGQAFGLSRPHPPLCSGDERPLRAADICGYGMRRLADVRFATPPAPRLRWLRNAL